MLYANNTALYMRDLSIYGLGLGLNPPLDDLLFGTEVSTLFFVITGQCRDMAAQTAEKKLLLSLKLAHKED